MTARYVDTSCVLRLLFRRPGRAIPLEATHVYVTSEVTRVEASRAIEHARLAGAVDDVEAARLRRALTELLARLTVFAVSDEVVELAAAPFGAASTSLAAFHAATAQVIQREDAALVFWTHETDRATAALSRGLPVSGLAER